jgi:diguanylate cyclase (GGDEF)-like protein
MGPLKSSLQKFTAKLLSALGSNVAPELRDELTLLQYERIRAGVPLLYLAAATLCVGASLAALGDFPLHYQYIFPGVVLVFCIVRFAIWRARRHISVTAEEARQKLRGTTYIATILCFFIGLWAVSAYTETHETRRLIAAFFVSMSAFAVATCLSSLPRAAIGAIALALGPVCMAMLLTADLGIRAIGICMGIVSILQVQLIRSKFDETVKALQLQHQLHHLAQTDPLTGLDNRRAFASRLEAQFSEIEKSASFAIAMIDLNGFKLANDLYGHSVGDEILIETGQRMRTLCRSGITVARLGGDEFALIFPPQMDAESVKRHIDAIDAMLALPYGASVPVTGISASIGLAWSGKDGNCLSDLLKVADHALYAEKALLGTSRGGYRRRRGGHGKKPDVRAI